MYKKQCGAILVISLIILFSLTFLVLSGSQTVVVQEKMTAAVRDLHISLEIAESGLEDAEALIDGLVDVSSFNDSGSNGRYSQDNGPADLFNTTTWADDKTSAATTVISGQVARYFIEYLGELPVPDDDLSAVSVMGYGETTGGGDVHAFKIASRSLGVNGNTERVVVSYYGKRF